ncbi:MAG: DUF1223 domain-containing protein [Bacteroidota bacterium]
MLCLSVLALLFLGFSAPTNEISQSGSGIAVVELFTSQGCSSCPAADRNLSQIINEGGDNEIYGLSFHVSYWNYLGWKDPYSKVEFTERQRNYAASFQNSNVYTPQMVVNGTREFVGSNKSASEKIIADELNKAPKHEILIEAELVENKISLEYSVTGDRDNYVLNIALVERDVTTKVPRGENRNKILHHDNVVREFISKPISVKSEHHFILPNDFNLSKGSVIAYVQNRQTMEITGVEALKF